MKALNFDDLINNDNSDSNKVTFLFKGIKENSNEWIFGNLIQDNNGNTYIIPLEDIELDGHHLKINSDRPIFIKKGTICQLHNSLTKKVGKNVFTGDIIKFEYVDCCGVPNTFSEEVVELNNDYYLYEDISVVGNIFDKK